MAFILFGENGNNLKVTHFALGDPTNKQQETLPAKVKSEKKIAQEGIQKD